MTDYRCAEGGTPDTYNVSVMTRQVIQDDFYCDGECNHTYSWDVVPQGITITEDAQAISHITGMFLTSGTYTVTFHCDDCGDTHIVYTVIGSKYFPKAQVRIFKDAYSFADVTFDMVTQPTVYKAVNRPGSFKFVLNNDPDDSYLSSSFAGWSDGTTGAIDWGMYCSVENISEDDVVFVTDGYITTLELNEYSLTVECADHLALLGSTGADIHRNYYDLRNADETRSIIVGQASDNYIEANVTDIYSQSGTIDTTTVKYYTETPYQDMDTSNTRYVLNSGQSTYYMTWYGQIEKPFKGMTFKFSKTTYGNIDVIVKVGNITKNVTITGNSGDHDVYVELGTMLDAGYYNIMIQGTPDYALPSSLTRVYVYEGSNYGRLYSQYANTIGNGHLCMNIASFVQSAATASIRASGSDTYLRVTAVTGYSISSDYSMLTYPSNNRVAFSYYTGTVSASEIITNVCDRTDYTPSIDTSLLPNGEPSYKLFRTGGGYALDYLQKIADTDMCMTFTASGIFDSTNNVMPTLYAGARRTSASEPSYNVSYGNTTQTISDLIMFQFRPSKSMKNRPSRVLIRTAISERGDTESEPVLALAFNKTLTDSRKGIKTDKAISNTSVLTVYDAVRSAYAEAYADEEDWSGTLTLSGIIPDMIDADGSFAGSGKVLSITDPRYGFTNKAFVVTDVTMDYETITTKVTLSNEAQIYGSAVTDAIALAHSNTDLVVGDTNSTLYNTQYVYVQTSAPSIAAVGNTISLNTTSKTISVPNVTAYVMDGHTLLYGSIIITSSNASTNKYDLLSLTVNGTNVPIPAEARPDCYEAQTVIVNVDVITV